MFQLVTELLKIIQMNYKAKLKINREEFPYKTQNEQALEHATSKKRQGRATNVKAIVKALKHEN